MKNSLRTLIVIAAIFVCALAGAQQTELDAAKAQALAVFKAVKGRDWKDLFGRITLAEELPNTPEARDAFAESINGDMDKTKDGQEFIKLMESMKALSCGIPVVEKDVAYVPTTCTVTMEGVTVRFLGLVKLKKVKDEWRWDLSQNKDVAKAAEERTVQLFGDPVEE